MDIKKIEEEISLFISKLVEDGAFENPVVGHCTVLITNNDGDPDIVIVGDGSKNKIAASMIARLIIEEASRDGSIEVETIKHP